MKRVLALCATAAVVAGMLACGGVSPMGGGGNGGGGSAAIPAMSPYMWATDLAGYTEGAWASYTMSGQDLAIKVVGKSGDSSWIQLDTKNAAGEYSHLLLVGADRKVTKAYFSGKDDKDWKETQIMESGATSGTPGTECAMCKKEHKQPETSVSDESVKVGDKDVACKKVAATMWDCEGKELKSTMWCSADVPALYAMMKSEHGTLVATEFGGNKTMSLTGFGADAKPKHAIPSK